MPDAIRNRAQVRQSLTYAPTWSIDAEFATRAE